MTGYFFLFGFVRIGLVFQSISDSILLIRSRYHLITHHESATCISQAASNANHCPRKADQCANKSRRERMHKQLSASSKSVVILIATWDGGRGVLLIAGSIHITQWVLDSVIPIFVIWRFPPFPYNSNYEVFTVYVYSSSSKHCKACTLEVIDTWLFHKIVRLNFFSLTLLYYWFLTLPLFDIVFNGIF